MKMNVMAGVALVALAVGAMSCSKSKDAAGDSISQESNGTMVYEEDGSVQGEVVGEEIQMPEAGTDANVIAEGTAVVVQQNQ